MLDDRKLNNLRTTLRISAGRIGHRNCPSGWTDHYGLSSQPKFLRICAEAIQVDWTIRLIVINSKLSGANSFQATMEHCFGKSGLIAISVS